MHYLLEFPLWLQGCGSICVCAWDRFKLILAELGITIKFKQNVVLCSLLSGAISRISWHPRRWLRIILLSLSLPFWDGTQTLVSALRKTTRCVPATKEEISCACECICEKGLVLMSKEDSAHELYCLQENGCILAVSERIQSNCSDMNLLI